MRHREKIQMGEEEEERNTQKGPGENVAWLRN